MKKCCRCKELKDESNFYRCSSRKDGLQTFCKECTKVIDKERYIKNRDKMLEQHKKHYERNKEKHLAKAKKWKKENKDRVLEKGQKYRDSHKEQIAEYAKKYRSKNKKEINKRRLDRLRNDPEFKLKEQARGMVRESFKRRNHRKDSRTKDLVGCDLDFLYNYLIKTWKNRYKCEWTGQPCHIDHIVPLSIAHTKEEIKKLCHYSNLQLLTPEDNMRKSNNLQWV